MPSTRPILTEFHKDYPVVCRPALPQDTEDIMELTRMIWEGEDYVPAIWGEWLEDYEGLLAVAESGGRVVGTGKLTLLTSQDWWLEGLRVSPDLQGRGIASHLHDYLLGYWLKKGQGTLRLATSSLRFAVHHMAERSGFNKVAEFTTFKAPANPSGDLPFHNLSPLEAREALEFARNSQSFSLIGYLMDLEWQWAAVNESYIAKAARQGTAWWWQGRRGLLVTREDRESKVSRQLISIVACQLDDLVELLTDYRAVAGKNGFLEASWSAPVDPQVISLLEQAGYTREWDDSVFIYALQHPTSQNQG